MEKVQLLSSDQEIVHIDRNVAKMSILLKNMFEDVDAGTSAPIPVPNVNAKILNKVFTWCEHHCNDQPEPDESNRRNTAIEEWDQKFMEVDQETLFEIIMAANFLDIRALLDLGCKTVANMIKGKTPEEIRKVFNIENDFTPEEEAQIRKENEWAEDR